MATWNTIIHLIDIKHPVGEREGMKKIKYPKVVGNDPELGASEDETISNKRHKNIRIRTIYLSIKCINQEKGCVLNYQ